MAGHIPASSGRSCRDLVQCGLREDDRTCRARGGPIIPQPVASRSAALSGLPGCGVPPSSLAARPSRGGKQRELVADSQHSDGAGQVWLGHRLRQRATLLSAQVTGAKRPSRSDASEAPPDLDVSELGRLERDGIVCRTMYPVMPPHVDYTLTPVAAPSSTPLAPFNLGRRPPHRHRRSPRATTKPESSKPAHPPSTRSRRCRRARSGRHEPVVWRWRGAATKGREGAHRSFHQADRRLMTSVSYPLVSAGRRRTCGSPGRFARGAAASPWQPG
jgi:hypothetical protein